METRRLGQSGLMVSELSLGTMIFGEQSERSTPPGEAKNILSRYVEAGGNFIDTANVYADGRSEEIIGEWLADQKRDELIIATKVRFSRGSDPNAEGLSRYHIMREVENSLRRLNTDVIDLYYAHMWDDQTPIEETLRAFDDLIAAGKVRYIGLSNFKAWQVMAAQAAADAHGYARFVAAQYQYSLVTRDIEYEYIDLFRREGLGQCPWGPLGGGFLSGKYQRGQRPDDGRISTTPDHDEESWNRRSTDRNWAIIDAVGAIAEQRGKTYAQVAINWLLTQDTVSSVIMGVRTMEQLEDNLGAVGWALTGEELAALDDASAMPDLYPYRMIEVYGGRGNS
ncbi:MAG: aldo/keto reductase [Anaerolineae bacterium]|nr:aldo/keto reductase [Anaerolineae bacterium]